MEKLILNKVAEDRILKRTEAVWACMFHRVKKPVDDHIGMLSLNAVRTSLLARGRVGPAFPSAAAETLAGARGAFLEERIWME